MRRAFRILPFFWSVVIFSYFTLGPPPRDLLWNATFLFGFNSNLEIRFVPGVWSLFVEETFYALFPFIFFALIRSPPLRWAFLALTVVIADVWLRYAVAELNLSHDNQLVWGSPLYNYFWFVIGIMIFYEFDSSAREPQRGSSMRLFVEKKPMLSFAVVMIGILCLPFLNQFGAALILSLLFFAAGTAQNPFYSLATSPILVAIGRWCYSIYFIHFFATFGMNRLWLEPLIRPFYLSMPAELQFCVNLICVVALTLPMSYLTYRFIELPSIALGKKVLAHINCRSI